MLSPSFNPENEYEIGVDEAGRGPLFGRLYVAAVLPPKEGFDNPHIKDSKKIKSKKKMAELAQFIKTKARSWAVHYIEHTTIDEINIRQAVFQGMHESIKQCLSSINDVFHSKILLLIDGNDFKPYSLYDKEEDRLMTLPHETVEQGDNTYQAIAAASILAKYSRDLYIEELCNTNPELSQRYSLDKNMGYGTRAHLDGIAQYGISQWHRRTYGRCREAKWNPVSPSITPLAEPEGKMDIP
jgi:ribonuclease HII